MLLSAGNLNNRLPALNQAEKNAFQGVRGQYTIEEQDAHAKCGYILQLQNTVSRCSQQFISTLLPHANRISQPTRKPPILLKY